METDYKLSIKKFTFGKKLGSGATGTVYHAKNSQDKAVAIKVIACTSQEQSAKVEQEISIISTLKHKNLIEFYGYDRETHGPNTTYYLVMELGLKDLEHILNDDVEK